MADKLVRKVWPVSALSNEICSPGNRGTENLFALRNNEVSAIQRLYCTDVNGNATCT